MADDYRSIKQRQRWGIVGTMMSVTFLVLGTFAVFAGSVLGFVAIVPSLFVLSFTASLFYQAREQEYEYMESMESDSE